MAQVGKAVHEVQPWMVWRFPEMLTGSWPGQAILSVAAHVVDNQDCRCRLGQSQFVALLLKVTLDFFQQSCKCHTCLTFFFSKIVVYSISWTNSSWRASDAFSSPNDLEDWTSVVKRNHRSASKDGFLTKKKKNSKDSSLGAGYLPLVTFAQDVGRAVVAAVVRAFAAGDVDQRRLICGQNQGWMDGNRTWNTPEIGLLHHRLQLCPPRTY